MHTFSPTVASFALHGMARKLQPGSIHEGTELVCAGHPEHHGRGVSHTSKPLLAFPQFFIGQFAFRDVEVHSYHPGGSSRLIVITAPTRVHPTNASIRPAR